MRKDLPKRLLRELLRNSKRSDRELAEILGVSQPTISRTRQKLEESGKIRDYTIIPDFREFGFEIMALTFFKMRSEFVTPEVLENARKHAKNFSDAILVSTGEGMGMTGVVISFHENLTDYHRHLNILRTYWKEILLDIQTFVIPTGKEKIKRFSMKYLADYVPL